MFGSRNKPLKIALLLKSEVGKLNKRNIGGTEQIFLEDLNQLKKQGYKMTAYARFRANKDVIEQINYPLFLLKIAKKIKNKRFSDLIYSLADLIYSFIFIIKSIRSDLLIGYSTPLMSVFFPSKTLIIMQNIHDLPFFSLLKKRYKEVKFLFCSKSLRFQFISLYPELSGKNLAILYNATDINVFKPYKKIKKQKQKYDLLYCSAWAKEKGLHILLDALINIPREYKQSIRLTIASNEEMWYSDFKNDSKKYISEVKKKIKYCKGVRLLGGVSHDLMPGVYNQADLLIFPSLWQEPFGRVVLESLACGLPVLAFKKGAVEEILSEENSIMLGKVDSKVLADAIVDIIEKKKLAKSNKSLLNKKNKLMIKEERLMVFIKYIQDLNFDFMEKNTSIG